MCSIRSITIYYQVWIKHQSIIPINTHTYTSCFGQGSSSGIGWVWLSGGASPGGEAAGNGGGEVAAEVGSKPGVRWSAGSVKTSQAGVLVVMGAGGG